MKAIAMKCTQEQFNAVIPRLSKKGFTLNSVTCFDAYPYLYGNIDKLTISNVNKGIMKNSPCKEIHETWNEKIFLEACGIEVMKPTLKEVKEYFKYAEFVETATFKEKRKIDLDSITTDEYGDFWCVEKESDYVFFIGSNKEGFAKILTTKEKTFSITAEQLMQLENGFTLPKLKQWFPEVFKVKLEVGKWYKSIGLKSGCLGFKGIGMFTDEEIESGFGLDDDLGAISLKSVDGRVWGVLADRFKEATEQEVFQALENEAEKRGFVDEGNMFEGMEDSTFLYKCKGVFEIIPQEELVDSMKGKTVMQLNRKDIFQNGKWATIIPTCTQSEAEKLLNKKIID